MAERAKTGKIALIGVLGIALAAILIRQSRGTSSTSVKTPGATSAQQNSGAGESPTAEDAVSSGGSPPTRTWERPSPVGPVARDPMHIEMPKASALQEKPEIVHAPAEAPEFRVAGIVFNTDQPSSIIIDGEILHEGETIHGATVSKITKEYGLVTRGEKNWIVRPGQPNREPE